ncbi:hypothetical protein C1701_09970 [Actinoalloteichus sp. AHMU CJ021]|uniref:hypothetical protein n=1 Tax=Actinoalloteichus TaxID=65496 RepID=UPI000CA08CB0|nr:hypothetical protein C1701_09970 [Actinoalloteichus sp. AHMU CJ021]
MDIPFAESDFPARPYPGARPPCSFVSADGVCYPLSSDPGAAAGWRVRPAWTDLDDWLASRGVEPTSARFPVLTYGSNACPGKIGWLRTSLGLAGPVVALRARCSGLAAVWASGFRVVDEQRPATLAAAPGTSERHFVWLATREQIRVLDRCEGRGERYRLVWLRTGLVTVDGEGEGLSVLAYTAATPVRMPLLRDGRPVRCCEVPQGEAARMRGETATSDGLVVLEVHGEPSWQDAPGRGAGRAPVRASRPPAGDVAGRPLH